MRNTNDNQGGERADTRTSSNPTGLISGAASVTSNSISVVNRNASAANRPSKTN